MNKIKSYRMLLWSENPDKLMPFYRDVLGMDIVLKIDLPDDYGYALEAGDSMPMWIGRHGDVVGKSKEPFRHMVNFYVDDVRACYEEIKDRDDIEIIQKPMVTPPTRDKDESEQLYVITFLDPEGNCVQLMESA